MARAWASGAWAANAWEGTVWADDGTDITGSMAATEAGADTAAINGGVAVGGDSAATESGADTGAFTGAVDVSGAFTASESGSDVAAITGVVETGEIFASVAAVEAGSDAGEFTGAVSVSGDVSASESGQDTAGLAGEVVGAAPEVVARRRRGHATPWIAARKRLALQTWIDYLTEETPAESTQRVIKEVKAGRPIPEVKPPKGPESISAEKLADKILPSRLWAAQNMIVDNVDVQRVVRNAIRIAQERDDEEILMLL